MEYVRLGTSGLKVSRACLGTMTFGREASEQTSFDLLDRYLDLGGNFLDTADMYSAGGAEQIVGKWLKQRETRDKVVLATKVWAVTGPGPNDGGLSRIHIQQAVEASLRRLQTDVIDLYQLHRWDPEVPIEETMGVLDDLVQQGKVRYVGCSNLAAWQLCEFVHKASVNGWTPFVSVQPVYNVINRSIESEILPLCHAKGIGVITYNPLGGGMLTGKYRRGETMPTGARLEAFRMYYERYYTIEALDIVHRFVQCAAERDVSPARLALAWVLSEPRVTCPIVGARSLEQFNDTIGGLTLHLSADDRATTPSVLPGRWVGSDPVYDRED